MKRLHLFTLLFSLFFGNVYSLSDLDILTLRPEVLDMIRLRASKPLTDVDKQQISEFSNAVGEKIPGTIFADIYKSKTIGYSANGELRDLSEDEKRFLRKHLAHLHLLKFLVFLNLKNIGLTELPDNLAEIDDLGLVNLEDNNIQKRQPCFDKMQEDSRIVVINLGGNPLPDSERKLIQKRTLEITYTGNVLTNESHESTSWNTEIAKVKFIGNIPNEPIGKPLGEVLLLSMVEEKEEELKTWIENPLNEARLARYMLSASPIEAAKFIAEHPEAVFGVPFLGADICTQKYYIVGMLLTRLMENELVFVEGNEIEVSKTIKHKEPSCVIGWTRYFTAEPIAKNKDTWLTLEGAHALLVLSGLTQEKFAEDFPADYRSVYEDFRVKYNVPIMLSEDVRFFRSIGVRHSRARIFTKLEREWLIAHLDKLCELPFLRDLSLSDCGVEDIPENFCKFTKLRTLFLRKNNIRQLTPSLDAVHTKFPLASSNFDLNPLMEGFPSNYNGRERVAYARFEKAVGVIPDEIADDIKKYKMIGVCPTGKRVYTEIEKQFLVKNLEHIHLLDYLSQLNLSELGIKALPNNLVEIKSLDKIYIEKNRFKQLPTVLADLIAKRAHFVYFAEGNPLARDAATRLRGYQQNQLGKEIKNKLQSLSVQQAIENSRKLKITLNALPEVRDYVSQKITKPLTDEERNKILKFQLEANESLPPELLNDLVVRSLGMRTGQERAMSQQEKDYLKKHLDKLYILDFIFYLNLSNLGLEDLPDNFRDMRNLVNLKVNGNKFKQAPNCIAPLLSLNELLFVEIDDNPMPVADIDNITAESIESLFAQKIYTEVDIDEETWHKRYFADEIPVEAPKHETRQTSDDDDNDDNDEQAEFRALAELMVLSFTDGAEDAHREWVNNLYNLSRIRRLMTRYSPEQLINRLVGHPDECIPERVLDISRHRAKLIFVETLVDHLCENSFIKVIGTTLPTETETKVFPNRVAGWSKYFTKEPVHNAEKVWIKPEGFQVLFSIMDLFDTQYSAELNDVEVIAAEDFIERYRPSRRISEEIRFFLSIGVKENLTRTYTPEEKEWVKENLVNFNEIPFLKHIELSELELRTLPASLQKLTKLKALHMAHNQFRKIPPVLAEIAAQSQPTMNFYANPLERGEQEKFDALCEKKKKEKLISSLTKSTLIPQSLKWSTTLVNLLNRGPLIKPEPARYTVRSNLQSIYDFWNTMTDDNSTEDRELRKNNLKMLQNQMRLEKDEFNKTEIENRKKYQEVFFELLLRMSQQKVNQRVGQTEAEKDEKTRCLGNCNLSWFDDPIVSIMLHNFLSSTTPEEFIKTFKNNEFLPSMLKLKRQYESARQETPELYPHLRDESQGLTKETLFERCIALFKVLTTHLTNSTKMLLIPDPKDPQKVECEGWQAYFTNRPNVTTYQGWFQELGLAELLVALGLAEVSTDH